MKLTREMVIQKHFLNLPIKNGAAKLKMRLTAEDQVLKAFEIELAEGKPDFWAYSDVGKFIGKRLTVQVEDEKDVAANALKPITQSDVPRGLGNLYREKHRPQIHFTSRRGWINDPNGLVYYKGEYHLFYQHNPYGWRWGNMHWGHAVSLDLVHWRELPDALEPDRLGTIFSGSAVVDWYNTAGFQKGVEKAIVCAYTSAGGTSTESKDQPFTQCIAYSNDRGRTWTKYGGNPVLPHIKGANRDPKVIWHKPTGKWVMALYLDENDYALFSSKNLKQWEQLCKVTVPGASECPDFFELPVDGDPGNTKWVFWAANSTYLLGAFNGQTYTREGEAQRFNWGGDGYAAQTWSDIPDKDARRIQIAWLRVNIPNMPFNQQMTFPCELKLRATQKGIRLFSTPVKEVEKLHGEKHFWKDVNLSPGENLLTQIHGDLFHIQADFQIGEASEFGFTIRGIPVIYDVKKEELTIRDKSTPLTPMDGKIRFQILVDRASIEVFGNEGIVTVSIGVIPKDEDTSLEVYSKGGVTRVNSLEAYKLRSTWA